MVVACLALGVALSGTGYAVTTLPRNSVGTAQLKNGAVTGSKVRRASLRARHFAAGQLPVGPQGRAGPQGPAGPTGPQGPQGPRGPGVIAALEELEGTSCTLGSRTGATAIEKPESLAEGWYVNVTCVTPDDYEPNNARSQPTVIPTGAAFESATRVGTIYPAGDQDWYRLDDVLDAFISLGAAPQVSMDIYMDGALVGDDLRGQFEAPAPGVHDWEIVLSSTAPRGYLLEVSAGGRRR
jgi:hypothetical protein